MKRICIILFLLGTYLLVSAQTPEKLSYQAIVRNANNELLQNKLIGMQISVLKSSITGVPIYSETHQPITNENGLVTLEIGKGTVLNGSFNTIDWANGPYFLRTQTDINGGSNYTITGTSELLSVPFALYAKRAANGLVAYGNVDIQGNKTAGSNNFSVTKVRTGKYEVSWDNTVNTYYSTGIVNLTNTSDEPITLSWTSTGGGSVLIVSTFNHLGEPTDAGFTFTVFQP